MDTDRQPFGDYGSTARAVLGSATREHLQKHAPSLCRFDARVLEELPPGRISHALVERSMPVGLHVLNVQIFVNDNLIVVDQLATRLVRKVGAAVRDPLIDVLHNAPGFRPCRCSFLLGAELALGFLQGLFVLAEETWVVYSRVVAQSGKRDQANIHPCHKGRWRQWRGFHLDRERSIPTSQSITGYRQRLDEALRPR